MRTLDSSVSNFGCPLPTFRSGLVSPMLVEFSNLRYWYFCLLRYQSRRRSLVAHPDCHSLLKSCMLHFRNMEFFLLVSKSQRKYNRLITFFIQFNNIYIKFIFKQYNFLKNFGSVFQVLVATL
jgi:hypothetical protein